MCGENPLSDLCPYVCRCVLRSQCAVAPHSLSLLPGWEGEGICEQMWKEPYRKHPCQGLGVEATQEQVGG